MSLLHWPPAQRWLQRRLLCRLEHTPDRFALTFDDGPSATNTPRLLELLDRHGVQATFFVLGDHVRRQPKLLRRLHEAGHEVGIHGDDHVPPPLKTPDRLLRDLVRMQETIHEHCGARPRFYRPPFGLITAAQAERARGRGLIPVLGDVYTNDAARPGARRIAACALARLRPGSILILHDASATRDFDRSQTIEALETILQEVARRGLAAASLRELVAATPHEPTRSR